MTPLESARSRLRQYLAAKTISERCAVYDDDRDGLMNADKWLVILDALLTAPFREEAIEAAKWYHSMLSHYLLPADEATVAGKWPWLIDEDNDE